LYTGSSHQFVSPVCKKSEEKRRRRKMSPAPDRDPLAILMAPPPNETPEEKAARLEEERLQQARNLEIEEMLRVEKMSLNNRKCVRVLLVGACLDSWSDYQEADDRSSANRTKRIR
jgi:hypothetical protein